MGVDEIIIDFEDSILTSNKEKLLPVLREVDNLESLWCRIPVRDNFEDNIDVSFLNKVLDLQINQIVLPKIKSKKELKKVFKAVGKRPVRWILLVEHPRLLVELNNILQDEKLERRIVGIALGSHDLITNLKAKYTTQNLIYPRTKVLYLAKGYEKQAIDIASMNVSQKNDFEEELRFGVENGFDAKFLIHPIQYTWMQEGRENSGELEWALEIIASIPSSETSKDVEPFILNGQIVEKAHVEKAFEIIKRRK